MGNFIGKVGDRIFDIVIVDDTNKRDKKDHIIWKCKCLLCGKIFTKTSTHLYCGNIQNCGCEPKKPPDDLTGKVFGQLSVLCVDPTLINSAGHPYWKCKCGCDNIISMPAHYLIQGRDKDCGCSDPRSRVALLYNRWKTMMQRCYKENSTNYHSYGGRGIKVDPSWHEFARFCYDMGYPPHGTTLGRIDNDGDYGPDNCQWETHTQQQRNKRNTKRADYKGINKARRDWMDEFKGSKTISHRIQEGWDIELAITAPEGINRQAARIKYEDVNF